jgi:hypothetical protein
MARLIPYFFHYSIWVVRNMNQIEINTTEITRAAYWFAWGVHPITSLKNDTATFSIATPTQRADIGPLAQAIDIQKAA